MVTRPWRPAARQLAIVALATMAGVMRSSTAEAHAGRHALHTTMTELRYEDRAGTVRATVRMFADDLGGALRRRGATSAPDSPAGAAATLAYLSQTFALSTADGRVLPLHLEGIHRTGDLLWVTVTSAPVAGLGGLRIRNALLMDVFADQVNIVQVADRGTKRSLLFTRGAGTKTL